MLRLQACALLLNDSMCFCLTMLHLTGRRLCNIIIESRFLDNTVGLKHHLRCDSVLIPHRPVLEITAYHIGLVSSTSLARKVATEGELHMMQLTKSQKKCSLAFFFWLLISCTI
jgi:hypothetical protein